jgi:hypothetical protein
MKGLGCSFYVAKLQYFYYSIQTLTFLQNIKFINIPYFLNIKFKNREASKK